MNINTKENWDKYHLKFRSLNYPEKFKFISRELLPLKGAKILELGSGQGYLLQQLKEDHPDCLIEGLDFSKVAVEQLKEKGFNVKEATIPEDLKNYSNYDAVIATEVVEHFEEETRLKIIQEVYRILKKGGKAIFTVPDNVMPPSEEKYHLVCYTKESFKSFLSKVFDLIGVTSRRYLVSDKPNPNGLRWGDAPFLFGVGYKA